MMNLHGPPKIITTFNKIIWDIIGLDEKTNVSQIVSISGLPRNWS
jgi:hypothetical protein